ncbi:hypothetical protein [Alkaliflexus imshenetskii]|nr:hypothetical protein [Alkaliflexus imshenetskii]
MIYSLISKVKVANDKKASVNNGCQQKSRFLCREMVIVSMAETTTTLR